MINLLFPLPKTLTIALSGGVDSVAITDFLSRKHNISCAFFHHDTDNSERAFNFVTEFCEDRNLPLAVEHINAVKPKKLSEEEHWRNERYKFLDKFDTVVTGHHLDDCVETYVMSCMHGTPKVIPSTRNNVVRPFLTTRKSEFIDWCDRKEIDWCQDLSNSDTNYMRNYVREHVLPHALVVNPGLHTMVKKIVIKHQTA